MGWIRGIGFFAVVFTSVLQARSLQKPPEFSELEALFGRHTSVEAFLPEWGRAHPEFQERYVLVHKSNSAQGASETFPRVISFNDDASLLIAFNGHPEQKGYYDIEVIRFDPERDVFEFRRFGFHPDLRGASAINPSACMGCHRGLDPRPNWEPYNSWPGVYGSSDHDRSGIRRTLGREEETAFERFLEVNAGKGRYAFLKDVEKRFLRSDTRRHPSLELTQKLGYLNSRRMGRLLKESPDYENYKFALLGALYDCDAIQSFLPLAIQARHEGTEASWIEKTEKLFLEPGKNYLNQDNAEFVGKLRYLMEGRGHSVRHWGMSVGFEPYNFQTPLGHEGAFPAVALIGRDAGLEPFQLFQLRGLSIDEGVTTDLIYAWRDPHLAAHTRICGELKEKSLSEWRSQ